MSFFVSEKVEYHHGVPSFDFVTDKKVHYTVFPKESVFKTYDEQDRAAHYFLKKMHGPAADDLLGDPFSTEVWHQNKAHYDVLQAPKVRQYLKNRSEGEEGEQTNMFDQAVRTASELDKQLKRKNKMKMKLLRRVMDLRQQVTTPKPPKTEPPKKGPGSYRRDKRIDF